MIVKAPLKFVSVLLCDVGIYTYEIVHAFLTCNFDIIPICLYCFTHPLNVCNLLLSAIA